MTPDAPLKIAPPPHLFDDTEGWLSRVAAVEARISRSRRAEAERRGRKVVFRSNVAA
jgi:hypothetical protein